MLKREGNGRSVVAPRIKASFWPEVSSKVCAENVLVLHDCRSRCLAKHPINVPSCFNSIDVRPMEILAKSRVMHKFEVVPRTVPEDLWSEVETTFRFGTDARHKSLIPFILVRIIGAVEGVGSVAFLREAELPIKTHSLVFKVALIEELPLSPRTVEGAAIASASTTADAVRNLACRERETSLAFSCAEGTALSSKFEVPSRLMLRDDIDGSAKALPAINATCCSFEHFDAFYIANAYGKVCRKMSCLGIADVDAVEQKRDLIKSAAIDADVRLNTKATTLTDVHACD